MRPYLRVLGKPDFRRLWTGAMVSTLGGRHDVRRPVLAGARQARRYGSGGRARHLLYGAGPAGRACRRTLLDTAAVAMAAIAAVPALYLIFGDAARSPASGLVTQELSRDLQ
jgi:hypothetical protein